MDWQIAITRNREALLTIIMALMASVGLVAGGTLTTLPYFLYRKALLILRQAESALRRLIVIAACDLELRGFNPTKTPPVSPFPPPFAGRRCHEVTDEGQRRRSFILIDPLKIFGQDAPDFVQIYAENVTPANHAPVPAASLALRLLALKHALNSIPKQAKRLARWYAQRDLALAQNQPHRLSPIRPGPPPASRRAKRTEMDNVLSECHSLAIYARDRRKSS